MIKLQTKNHRIGRIPHQTMQCREHRRELDLGKDIEGQPLFRVSGREYLMDNEMPPTYIVPW